MPRLDSRAPLMNALSLAVPLFLLMFILEFVILIALMKRKLLLGNAFSLFLIVAALTLPVVILISFLYAIGYSKSYYYELQDDSFFEESGILHTHAVNIPYTGIQNVTIKRGLIARSLGLAEVIIRTASMQSYGQYASPIEARIRGIPFDEAKRLRDELIKRARQTRA